METAPEQNKQPVAPDESPKSVSRILIITGARGVGKSTVCQSVVTQARGKGYTCRGLVTLRARGDGLDVLDVASGALRRLTLEPGAESAVIQGRFRFDPATLAWGNAVLARALPCDLLVIDELGPLEFESRGGWLQAFEVLQERGAALALVVVRPELLAEAQARWRAGPPSVLTVTPENRVGLPATVIEELERAIGSRPASP